MKIVGVDVQAEWEVIGLELGLEPSTLNNIAYDNGRESSACMRRVFTKWHDGETSEYSWRQLAEVLCQKTVDKKGLLPAMLKTLQKNMNYNP